MSPSLSPDEHRRLVESLGRTLAPRAVPLSRALGCVLAEPLAARLPVPPFTNSAMDGFAVHASDLAELPATLPVAGDIPAGDAGGHAVAPGTAWRIMTGAPMPSGADTVVKVEMTDHAPHVTEPPGRVTIRRAPAPGANVRHAGEDVEPGAPVLPAGVVLGAAALSAAASVGYSLLPVVPRPRVGIVTAGSELADPGARLGDGEIPDSNSVLLCGLVEAAGGIVAARVRSADAPEALLASLADWPELDVVITAGGISAGAYEVVRQALASAAMRFHRVAQQPGGPQGVGTVSLRGRGVPALCLPGNPVSVFVSFHVYAAGLLAMLAGKASCAAPRRLEAVAGVGWASPAGKAQFMPVVYDGGSVRPVHRLGSSSHLAASVALADGLAVVDADVTRVAPGERVGFLPTRLDR